MNTPNIRFKGFTNAWEKRKLSEETVLIDTGKSKFQAKDSGKYEILGSTSVIGYDDNYDYEGDFLLTARVGANAGELYRHSGQVKISDNTVFIQGEHLDYTYYSLMNFDIKKLSFGTGQPLVKASELKKLVLLYPSKEEREKIGSYFRELDNQITLHQRKCDDLKEVKKYMLQKMFPKKGEKVPEIRFKGFTGDWENRKLGELIEKYEDPVETPHDGYERLGIRSHAKGTFHSVVEAGKELESAKMHRVAADKFILNITFAWEHAVAITDKEDEGKLVSHRFPQFSFKYGLKSHFFKYYMLDKKFREHLELCSPGGAGRNRVLKISDMMKYIVLYPSIEEQQKIAHYLDTLDNQITLYQKKLDTL